MAGNAADQKKAHLNRPMTTCTDIGDGKRLCITISLQECLKAINQPPQSAQNSKCSEPCEKKPGTGESSQSAPSKPKCSEPCETSKNTGSGTGGGGQSGSCGTGGTGGSSPNASAGPGGTGGGSQSGSCGTGGTGGSSQSAPSKPKCSSSCAAYTKAGSGTGGGSQSGSCGTGGTGGSSPNASAGPGGTGGGSQSGSCGTGSTGGTSQSAPSKPKCSPSCAAYTNAGSGTAGGSPGASSGTGDTGGGSHSGSCGTGETRIGNQGSAWTSEGPQAGNQNLSCGTGMGNQGRVCGSGVPRGGAGMGVSYGMYQCGSPGPKKGYYGYSQEQGGMGGGNQGFSHGQGGHSASCGHGTTGGGHHGFSHGHAGTGGGNQGFSCGHGSTGGGHQSYGQGPGNTGGGNQGFSCGQGGSYGHGPCATLRPPVHCGTGVGNQGSSCGHGGTGGGSNQGFTRGSEGTVGRTERYCCDQGKSGRSNESAGVNQKTVGNQVCCDSGGTGLGMPDYSCQPKPEPEPEPKRGFFSSGPPDRGPGFCPKREGMAGGGAGGGSGGGTVGSGGGACATHSICREPGEVKAEQKGYGVHHCGVVVGSGYGARPGECGAGAEGRPKGCSNINDTSTPDISPAELQKSILESSIKLAEHQTMPVSQDQVNPQVSDDNSKQLPPEQTLVNAHSDTFFDDKHETNETKNNLDSSSEPIVNFSSDQYQTVYPQQASNVMEENNSFKKSVNNGSIPSIILRLVNEYTNKSNLSIQQFINDTPSLLEQGLSKLLEVVRSYNKPMARARQEPDIEKDHVPGCPFYDDDK